MGGRFDLNVPKGVIRQRTVAIKTDFLTSGCAHWNELQLAFYAVKITFDIWGYHVPIDSDSPFRRAYPYITVCVPFIVYGKGFLRAAVIPPVNRFDLFKND